MNQSCIYKGILEANLNTKILLAIEYITKINALIIHLAYFYYVFKIKKFNTNKLIYLHHVNFVSFLIVIHSTSYFSVIHPNPSNEIFCSISEATWIILRFMRCYSVLQLSIYQYIATFKNNFFIDLSNSKIKIYSSLVGMWIISITYYLILKSLFQTHPDYLFCYDGFSLLFFFINSFNIIIPTIIVVIIYSLIIRRLKELARRLHRINYWAKLIFTCNGYLNISSRQFLLIIISTSFSSLSLFLLNIGILLKFDEISLNFRQVMRVISLIFLSVIPLSSIIHHQHIINERKGVRI
jgi:hypothetical protein